MKLRVPVFALGCGLLLAGCGSLGQLDEYQSAMKEGRLQAIVDKPVSGCERPHDGCARLHSIRGDACFQLAMNGRAPDAVCPAFSADARERLACAAREYGEANAAGDGSVSAEAFATIAGNRTLALYCGAEFADTPAAGVALAQQAASQAQSLAAPQRQLFAGWAALYQARPGAGSDDQRCAAATRAASLAREGERAGSGAEDQARLERLARDAAARRSSIPACGA
jgi:outer membrane murein-binding lipoprotein Lpp